jgi:predicted GTPase
MDMKENDAFYSEDFGNDIKMAIMEKMSSMVQKRDNVMTAEEYCKVMRRTNAEQRELILEYMLQISTMMARCIRCRFY